MKNPNIPGSDEWCEGSNKWFRDDAAHHKAADAAKLNEDDPAFKKLLKKKHRCPECNRRLQLETNFNEFGWYEFHGVRYPWHKRK